ncbi:Rrf2 family transcriptional regulator [Aureimonas sp. AU40]|uniref:Rrf2 family transcriptional regulator n=1 Tax=Aureimonas sp. AU40 TaxID=1637747 RepID=UPI000A946F9E|nr:Rrf2 family transcriptional regulator [Aureimonas sp. AU40]
MAKDARLTRVTHVLVHMAEHGGLAASDRIAEMLGTNPVVVRRMMGLLRNAGLVRSTAGARGGWQLTRELRDITLLEVHRALQSSVFAIDAGAMAASCKVERAANEAIAGALDTGRQAFENALANITLDDVRAATGL